VHRISYSILIETVRLSCSVFEIQLVSRRKRPILTYPTRVRRPRRGWSRSISPWPLASENKSHGAIVWHCLRDHTFSRFDTIPVCGRQTDRQTDRHTTTAYCASIASRGRNQFGFITALTYWKQRVNVCCMQITVDNSTQPAYKLCGTRLHIAQVLTFDAASLILTFRSDYSVTRKGFEITYKIISRKGLQHSPSLSSHYYWVLTRRPSYSLVIAAANTSN